MPKKKKTKKKGLKGPVKKKGVTKEEVSEIFEVENGKEKIIEAHAEVEKKEEGPSEEQIKKEREIFKIIIIAMIGFVLMFFIVYMIINSMNKFNVGGVIFEIDTKDIAGKTIYKTSLPVADKNDITGKAVSAYYNFYLRNDPRKLEKEVPFYGVMYLKKNMVINMTKDFNCEGDGIIGMANLLTLYKTIGTTVIKDENASCDRAGRYAYLTIEEGNETYIDRIGPACYNIYIKDCEILEGTEKFMLETLIEVNKEIKQ